MPAERRRLLGSQDSLTPPNGVAPEGCGTSAASGQWVHLLIGNIDAALRALGRGYDTKGTRTPGLSTGRSSVGPTRDDSSAYAGAAALIRDSSGSGVAVGGLRIVAPLQADGHPLPSHPFAPCAAAVVREGAEGPAGLGRARIARDVHLQQTHRRDLLRERLPVDMRFASQAGAQQGYRRRRNHPRSPRRGFRDDRADSRCGLGRIGRSALANTTVESTPRRRRCSSRWRPSSGRMLGLDADSSPEIGRSSVRPRTTRAAACRESSRARVPLAHRVLSAWQSASIITVIDVVAQRHHVLHGAGVGLEVDLQPGAVTTAGRAAG